MRHFALGEEVALQDIAPQGGDVMCEIFCFRVEKIYLGGETLSSDIFCIVEETSCCEVLASRGRCCVVRHFTSWKGGVAL